MKHRANSSKIKYEHAMIAGLRLLLESIESWDEILAVIPAEIRPVRATGRPLQLHVQYATRSGLKVLAKESGAVQEVFFVTVEPDALRRRIEALSRTAYRSCRSRERKSNGTK